MEQWSQENGQKIELLRHTKNLGISAARNTGIRHLDTDLIALLDSDDMVLPTRLATLGKAFHAFPDAVTSFADSK